jgi:hypothetical protein
MLTVELNVLVDDFGKYLDAWSNAGGIAVKHEDTNTAHTIHELEKIYAPIFIKLDYYQVISIE